MQTWFNYIAIFLIFSGVLIRFYCILANKSFSLVPEIPSEICKTGIYKVVRHPAYFGTLLFVCGFAFLIGGFGESVLFTFLFWIVLSDRARVEERIISAYLPEYKDYKGKTAFIIPIKL